MFEINWDWLGGFVDGEGCLGCKIKKNTDYNLNYEFSPNYRIGQTGEIGREILKEIQIFLKNQGIKSNYKEEKDDRENCKDKHYLSIEAYSDVKKFTYEIKKHTRIKEVQIKIFEQKIIAIMERNGHLKQDGFLEIVYWKKKIDSYKGGGIRSKYDVEFFQNKWNINQEVGGGDYFFEKREWGSVFDY